MFVSMPGTVNDVWPMAVKHTLAFGADVPSRVARTLELHPAVLRIDDPTRPLVTSYGRPVNPAFALAEVLWILQGREDVEMLQYYNSTIGQYSDDGETFNAAYGDRIRSHFGHDQLGDMITQLKDNPESRQAILNIWSPRKDRTFKAFDAGYGPDVDKRVTKDRACNIVGHALIRDGKLDWSQFMRSNDIMWGTPNNFMQWLHIQQFVAGMVGVPVGTYYHYADSLHLYEYHFGDAERVEKFDLYKQFDRGHFPAEWSWHAINEVALFEEKLRTDGDHSRLNPFNRLTYWHEVCEVFRAWAMWKEKDDINAAYRLGEMQDPVLASAQARFFYWFRWYKGDIPIVMDRLRGWRIPDPVKNWLMSGHKQADS